jgi:hypothetical protein
MSSCAPVQLKKINAYIRKLREVQRFLEKNYTRSSEKPLNPPDQSLNNLRINTYWSAR